MASTSPASASTISVIASINPTWTGYAYKDAGNRWVLTWDFRRRGVVGEVDTQAAFADGAPSGRLGVWGHANVTFDDIQIYSSARQDDTGGRWRNPSPFAKYNAANDELALTPPATSYKPETGKPILLQGLRLTRFEATFSHKFTNNNDNADFAFVFNATDQDDYDVIELEDQEVSVQAGKYVDGTYSYYVAAASVSTSGTTWWRIACDGTNVTVKRVNDSASAPSEGTWSGVSASLTTSGFSITGGMIGFEQGDNSTSSIVDNLTVKSDRDNNGSYETTEHVDEFVADGDGFVDNDPTYDAAGNLTYDGVYKYTYDAWNRLVKVTKAYRDGGGTVQTGSVVNEIEYDGLGRRIVKQVKNSADLDCTYRFYHDGDRVVEVRNGSEQVIKQYVWGALYIDELVQVGLNDDPTDGGEQNVESFYYALHDTHFNVIGLIDSTGNLVERYDYTPYGQRTVYFSPGTNDPDCHAPTLISRRKVISSVNQPWGLCEVGFQGLMHDEETGNVHNRGRVWSPTLGRFLQRDPIGYPDGLNGYAGYHALHGGTDPSGYGVWKKNGTYIPSRTEQIAELAQGPGGGHFFDAARRGGEAGETTLNQLGALQAGVNRAAAPAVAVAQAVLNTIEDPTYPVKAVCNAASSALDNAITIAESYDNPLLGGLAVLGFSAADATGIRNIGEGISNTNWLTGKSIGDGFDRWGQIFTGVGQAAGAGAGAMALDDLLRPNSRMCGTCPDSTPTSPGVRANPDNCFVAGTLVATESGKKPIEKVGKNERVWSYNHDTGQWELCRVVEPMVSKYDDDVVTVTIRHEDGSEEQVRSTKDHPYWVVNQAKQEAVRPLPKEVSLEEAVKAKGGNWVGARHLTPGDQLLIRDGKSATVVGLQVRRERLLVYNLHVERLHNFAVGTHGVVVHNVSNLPDDAIVVKGGLSKNSRIDDFIHPTQGHVVGTSAQSQIGLTIEELAAPLPHPQIRTTTAGDVRAAGGDVVPTTSRTNPNHATITDLSPVQIDAVLGPPRPNPARQ